MLIIIPSIYTYAVSRKGIAYKILSDSELEGRATAAYVPQGEDDDPAKALRAQAQHSTFTVDRPRGQFTLLAVEIVALLGQIGVFVAILVTDGWGSRGTFPAVAGLISWSYILFLTLIRVVLSARDLYSFLRIWTHTAALYGLQWLFVVFNFRSALIHPISTRASIFTSIEFALASVLLLLTVVTRKGNKPVLVQHEYGMEPPRHPMASLLSLASFSWFDPLIFKGYRQTLELEDIWNLTPSQQASRVLEDFRHQGVKGSLLWRLTCYFYGTVLLQGAWSIFSNLFTFLPTILLQAILQYVEDPTSTTANAAWLYAILLFCCGAIMGTCDGQSLWIGRKFGVKLRAIIIGEIYAKALRRKAGAAVGKSLQEASGKEEIPKSKDTNNNKKNKKNKIFSFGGNKNKAPSSDTGSEERAENGKDTAQPEEGPPLQANTGTIVNLMAIDSFKVSEVGAYLHFLWAGVPVQVVMAVALLYRILGFSSFAGIALMVLMMPVNLFIARQFQSIQHRILACTDARIHATNEVLQNIRIIKYFAWERRFEDIVDEKRRAELKSLRTRYIVWSAAATMWYGTPILITFASFFLFTVVEKRSLTPSVAFPALSLFNLLRVPLDQLADMIAHVQESKVSLNRVDTYLNEDETEKYTQVHDSNVSGEPPKIALEKATLTWGQSRATDAFRLINMDVSFNIGKLSIVAGATGSGKTSLLMALLGEMRLLDGKVFLPGGKGDRTELPIDPATGLMESVAYCAQEAWLVNDSIMENIVFASQFDPKRYKAVIKACALGRDFEILASGDQTLVGEKGISLSGGQKQRISLARAVYSSSRHLLLDDCLSAVDSHTAKHIFQEALRSPLMFNRTCILVTHNVALTVPAADRVIVLDNGKIAVQGAPDDVAASGALGEELLRSRPSSKPNSQGISRVTSDLEERREEAANQEEDNGLVANQGAQQKTEEPHHARLAEAKAHGSIKMSTVKMYLKAMGSWYYWVVAAVVFIVQQLASVSTNIWIREWANAYSVEGFGGSHNDTDRYSSLTQFKFPSFNAGGVPRTTTWTANQLYRTKAKITATDTPPGDSNDVQVSYYLWIYALLGLLYVAVSLIREIVLFLGSLHASWGIHKRLLKAILHAKFKFFDSTPLGQMMNRFAKDVEAVDQDVSPVAIGTLHSLASVIMIVILISVITPGFLVAGTIITLVYSVLGAVYLNASRDLKRLESVERSPLYQQFGETLNGIVTIRAYGDGTRFAMDNYRRINCYNRPHIYLWASNRWLAFRVDITGALVSFFSAAFVLLNVGKVDAGAAGLSLTYAVTFTENILWLVRLYAEVQQSMNSVERVKEYLDVEQEAQPVIANSRPPPGWPGEGAVEFENYTTRYRPELDPVLRNVSFSVHPGEKIGIVGRTGAGKSSLALALFRGLEADQGKIIIDGIDISTIGLRDLRESITIVPQDPTLFTGTIRSNLDPFGHYTDEEVFTALRRVHLIGNAAEWTATPLTGSTMAALDPVPVNGDDSGGSSSSSGDSATVGDNKNIFHNLESPVAESGTNLSQGQRQLLCLARALLKKPRVLMMDEATASIDYATDSKIQETLGELRESTIITIAHRLQTIIDYDKVLVLDRGEVKEYDHPWILIRKDGSIFQSMCENTGNMESLLQLSKKAWDQRQLVDVDS